ncbi:MAG: hypothetical protein F6J96_20950 [Symploca sp. SIO1C2]|nr:hypothetical protein [Symploca sp. SIO1C2]
MFNPFTEVLEQWIDVEQYCTTLEKVLHKHAQLSKHIRAQYLDVHKVL